MAGFLPTLRKHLAECTFVRVQAPETGERAQEVRQQARETVKQSQQLGDDAARLMRQAENAQPRAREVERGQTSRPEGEAT